MTTCYYSHNTNLTSSISPNCSPGIILLHMVGFLGSTSSSSGGCISLNGANQECFLVLCTFHDCYSGGNGGAIYSNGLSTINMEKCCFFGCSASSVGQALYLMMKTDSTTYLTQSTFSFCPKKNSGSCRTIEIKDSNIFFEVNNFSRCSPNTFTLMWLYTATNNSLSHLHIHQNYCDIIFDFATNKLAGIDFTNIVNNTKSIGSYAFIYDYIHPQQIIFSNTIFMFNIYSSFTTHNGATLSFLDCYFHSSVSPGTSHSIPTTTHFITLINQCEAYKEKTLVLRIVSLTFGLYFHLLLCETF